MTILDKEIDLWTAFTEEQTRKVYCAFPSEESKKIQLKDAYQAVVNAMLEVKRLTTRKES